MGHGFASVSTPPRAPTTRAAGIVPEVTRLETRRPRSPPPVPAPGAPPASGAAWATGMRSCRHYRKTLSSAIDHQFEIAAVSAILM
ncbi:MAG TPA: hypothetical protein VHK47_05950 [Polyangia bacterium]|nr:hypothetical protein [Polyangia bacterium]